MANFAETAAHYEKMVSEQGAQLQEALSRLDAMQDANWLPLLGGAYSQEEGPSLEQVRDAAQRNQEQSALQPWVGGGETLIYSYVWGDGIHYAGVPGKARGRGKNVQEIVDRPKNQIEFFGQQARRKRQSALYNAGIALYSGDDRTTEITQIPIGEITDDYRNPDQSDEIWAYRRTWTRHSTESQPKQMSEWIFVHAFHDKMRGRATMNYRGVNEPIAKDKRMFVLKSNPVAGWAYGVSDVQRGIAYAGEYQSAMSAGKRMNDSMASILGQMKHNSQAGADRTAIQMGNSQPGAFLHTGVNQDASIFASAGNAYDFQKLLPILAGFAAGIGVSVIALSMNSGNAGGSYGAARSLDRPEQLSTKARRRYNIDLDREVLVWMGADPDKLDIWFDPITDETERYRGEQIIELRAGTGLYTGIELKRMHAVLDGRDPNKIPDDSVPEGWLIPNNEKSLALKSIDTDGQANPANGGDFAPTQGSGSQFSGGGSGDQGSDDIRNREGKFRDIGVSLQLEELSGKVELLLARLDAKGE